MPPTIRLEKTRWASNEASEEMTAVVHLPEAAVIGIVGPSGVGKSTLIKAVAGGFEDLVGEAGIERSEHEGSEQVEVVYLPQETQDFLLPWASMHQHFRIASRMSCREEAWSTADSQSAMRMLGLTEDLLRKPPSQLSGGQRRRLALASGLIRGGEVLLLDEPFVGLDFDVRVMAWDALWDSVKSTSPSMRGNYRSCLLVSHGLDDLAAVCDSVIPLAAIAGIIKAGEPVEIPDYLRSLSPPERIQDRRVGEWRSEILALLTPSGNNVRHDDG